MQMRGIRQRILLLLCFLSLITVLVIVICHQRDIFIRSWPSITRGKTTESSFKWHGNYETTEEVEKTFQIPHQQSIGVDRERQSINRSLPCNATKHVLFLKTHKTGSSTITNILNRFGDKHNLTFALPRYGSYRFDWPQTFKSTFINWNRLRYGKPEFFCNHARYDWNAMSTAMADNTLFLTILRHPQSNFESVFSYFELAHSIGIPGESEQEQIRNFFKNLHSNLRTALKKVGPSGILIHNGMMFDLGLNKTYFKDKDYIKKHIRHLEEKFHLILIMEHLDESLVLLRRQLCWSLEDVTYFVFLQRQTGRLPLPADVKMLISELNQADFMLYDHFNKTLWGKIRREGPGFSEEVVHLKELNKQLYDKCASKTETVLGHHTKVTSVHMKANVTRDESIECCRMTWNEVEYLRYHNKKQMPFRDTWMIPPNMGC